MIYYKELVLVSIKTEKPHSLLSPSWRSRKTCGVVPILVQTTQWFKFYFKGWRKLMSPLKQTERTNCLCLCLFVLYRSSMDWGWQSAFLSLLVWMLNIT